MFKVEDQISALRLFNEKVRELLGSSFVKGVTDPDAGFSLVGEPQEDGSIKVRSMVRGPSDESVRAFVLTFRFFIQDNETVSLRNISALYDSGNIDPQQRAKFQSARNEINRMLDSQNFLNISFESFTPTNRQIMDVFVYGGLAHANPQKYHAYKDWMSFPPVAVMFQACFNKILGHILQALAYIEQVNVITLGQLNRRDP